jgi:hypothetical protein
MALYRAAALVLVVWYLLMLPLRRDGTVSSFAPLMEWGKLGMYDTFDECQKALDRLRGGLSQKEAATCIASDDPRLKER